MVPHGSEDPIRQASARDAHQIHHPVAGGAQLRAHQLAEHRHAIAVEEAPAQAEHREEEHRHAQVRRVPHAEQRRHQQGRADGADEDASSDLRAHPAVRQPAAQHRADDRGDLPIEHRGDARLALSEVEAFAQDVRHPIPHDPSRHRRQGEVDDHQQEVAVTEERADRRADAGRLGFRRFNRPVTETQEKRYGIGDADQSAPTERITPADGGRIGGVTGEPAGDHAEIDAHLVQADRAGTGRS